MTNVVIPMAGGGSRFARAGHTTPKPFILVNGTPMIERVIDNIALPDACLIFICQSEHLRTRGAEFIDRLKRNENVGAFEIIMLDGMTDGPASTVLAARPFIDHDDELFIINSDQLIGEGDARQSLDHFRRLNADGGILAFHGQGPQWSYIALDDDGGVARVAEKQPISELATCGIYYFRSGATFVEAGGRMIEANDRVNGEFYVAPVYNDMIARGATVAPFFVSDMQGLGTPDDLMRHEAWARSA